MRSVKLLLCLMVVLACSAAGAEWPQFRGLNRDGISPEEGLLTSWPQGGPKLLWSVENLGFGYSSASIADGMVYTTGIEDETGYIYAFDLEGNPKWKRAYGKGWTGQYPGSRTTPTIDEGLLYVMSGHGVISCFDAKTGKPVWSVDTFDKFKGENIRWGIAESVLIDGRKAICSPGGKDATVVALDKKTGETIWRSKGLSEKSAYCSPIVVERGDNRVLLTMVEQSIVGLDVETGEVFWRVPHKTSYDISAVTPAYENGIMFVTNAYRKGSFGFQLSPDGTSVQPAWDQRDLDVHHGGVVLLGNDVHGASSNGTWMCVDLRTGNVKYEADLVGKGSVIWADGMLYCYGERGRLGLVKPGSDAYEMVSVFEIEKGEKQHWAHPAISDGVLYVRHGEALMAFDIKAK